MKTMLFMYFHALWETVLSTLIIKTLNYYIGHTTITLSPRITCHLLKLHVIHLHIDQHIIRKLNMTINIKQI